MDKLRALMLAWLLTTWFASLAGATNHTPVLLVGPAANPSRTLQYNPCVRLSAVAVDPDGDPVTYTWDLGDGRHLHGASVEAWWNNKRTYTITLIVADNKAGITSATLPMDVGDSLYMSRPVAYADSSDPAAVVITVHAQKTAIRNWDEYR